MPYPFITRTIPARARRLALAAPLAALLGACANLAPDAALAPVQQAAQQHLGQSLTWVRSDADSQAVAQRVAELLAEPLTAETAVQVALLNNRGLQAQLHALGVADAERVQASRLPNPGFGFARLTRAGEREIERSLSWDLGHWLALPWRRALEQRRLDALAHGTSLDMLGLAARTRMAFYRAVAAAQTTRYRQDVKVGAEAGAELARRMAAAGNWNTLQRAREQGFYADAVLELARAQQAEAAAREQLVRLLGLWGEQTAFKLPDRLPELPAAPEDQPDIERLALTQRIDLQAARAEVDAGARGLGLTRATRWVDTLELGLQRNSSSDAPPQSGWELGFEVPLFDWGDARQARAQGLYLQALQRAAQATLEARSEVRQAYLAYRSAWDIARHHRDEIVPNARRIADENLLRYNGMLIGVFELLADARAQVGAVMAAIQAQRDFWLAHADLQMALVGKPLLAPAEPSAGGTSPAGSGGGAAH